MVLPHVTTTPLRRAYDVVIIGAGVQGLALAYELARRGLTKVAVLERGWPGGGASGRNGELIRSAFSSPEWTNLFDHSLRRWHGLSEELDFNVLFSPSGYLVLASTEAQLERCRRDAQRQRERGLRTELLGSQDVRRLVPAVNADLAAGGVYQADGGFAHHDAVVWAYLRAAARLGAEVHTGVEVRDIVVAGDAVTGVRTTAGSVSAPVVVNAAGGFAPRVNQMAGVTVPLTPCRLEMIVTESLRPFLRPGLAALELLGYCHQTARGEFVGGTELPVPDETTSLSASYPLLRDMARKFVRLFPLLAGARLLRHWAGTVSQTADLAPVVGPHPDLTGYHLTVGWVYGFMGAPAAADLLAETIVSGVVPDTLVPFGASRLWEGRLIREESLVVPAEEEVGS